MIARDGTPVARLVPVPAAVRAPGRWRGEVVLAEDFDDTPEELIALFEGD